MGYFYILSTIFFTVYGQLIIKWQMNIAGSMPVSLYDKVVFLIQVFLRPWVISAFISAFIASLCWMAAMTKFELSYAYPFMSLSFVFVLILSGLFFHEAITITKILGVFLILSGIVVSSR